MADTEQEGRPSGRPGREELTLVVAEDAEVVLEQLRQMLGTIAGVRVVATARTGDEALREARERDPDVLLLDLGLPGPGGIAVIRRLRSEGYGGRIVVLSNQSDPTTRSRCLRAGAEVFFDKSTEFGRAIAAIRELVVARGLDRELDGES